MIINEIREELFRLQDTEYRDFQSKLIPTAGKETFIGVRTPELRCLAKQIAKRDDLCIFLEDLPHKYFDENQLHAFIISDTRDFNLCLERLDVFLHYVDNWATCDQMSPKVFKKHRNELAGPIKKWITDEHCYTVRFGIGMLMEHFLDNDFDPSYLELVAEVVSEEYYIKMMKAWYFATALAKQYDAAIPYLENKRLDTWTHNKTIRKAIESYRVGPAEKEYLRSLKLKDCN
ncbi:MAG: DNA alkylation repair protein [Oscillospiraceae bacterium]|nr:DNA alkylation repair protein [Oscillospiraceae bacterium]